MKYPLNTPDVAAQGRDMPSRINPRAASSLPVTARLTKLLPNITAAAAVQDVHRHTAQQRRTMLAAERTSAAAASDTRRVTVMPVPDTEKVSMNPYTENIR